MARVKGGTTARNRRKKILKEAKGYFGSKHRLFKTAKEQLMHSWTYAFRDRKQKKGEFRKLFITRINAACRENEISYSKFINGLNKSGIAINRKMLSELAISSPESFKELVVISKNALEGKEYKPAKVELTATSKRVEKKAEEKSEEKSEKKAAIKKTSTTKTTAKPKTNSTKTTTKKTTAKKEVK